MVPFGLWLPGLPDTHDDTKDQRGWNQSPISTSEPPTYRRRPPAQALTPRASAEVRATFGSASPDACPQARRAHATPRSSPRRAVRTSTGRTRGLSPPGPPYLGRGGPGRSEREEAAGRLRATVALDLSEGSGDSGSNRVPASAVETRVALSTLGRPAHRPPRSAPSPGRAPLVRRRDGVQPRAPCRAGGSPWRAVRPRPPACSFRRCRHEDP